MSKWLFNGTVVTETDKFFFTNSQGEQEKFGAGDFQNPDKIAEAGLILLTENIYPAVDSNFYTLVESISADTIIYTTVPKITLEEAKALKLTQLTARRKSIEEGGVAVGEAIIASDRQSQAMVNNAIRMLELDAETTSIPWKAENGWVDLTLTDLQGIAITVGRHVENCFAVEKSKSLEIEALTTYEDIVNYDLNIGW